VEPLAGILGVVLEQLASLEWGTIVLLEFFHLGNQLVGAVSVNKPEGAAGERRETQSKHGSNITLELKIRQTKFIRIQWRQQKIEYPYRVSQDAFFQAENCLIDETGHHSKLKVFRCL
jgi:hypothetical protein